eukprot:GHVS01003437.1.p2 GENE.GHVS01003437.1~~GHVS01003437.1.p2  ORF type:complete len:130 (-),score=6.38 GHVS01003437.1:111-500(-)
MLRFGRHTCQPQTLLSCIVRDVALKHRTSADAFPPRQVRLSFRGITLCTSIVAVEQRAGPFVFTEREERLRNRFFEAVIEHYLFLCNRLPRPIWVRPMSSQDNGGSVVAAASAGPQFNVNAGALTNILP